MLSPLTTRGNGLFQGGNSVLGLRAAIIASTGTWICGWLDMEPSGQQAVFKSDWYCSWCHFARLCAQEKSSFFYSGEGFQKKLHHVVLVQLRCMDGV